MEVCDYGRPTLIMVLVSLKVFIITLAAFYLLLVLSQAAMALCRRWFVVFFIWLTFALIVLCYNLLLFLALFRPQSIPLFPRAAPFILGALPLLALVLIALLLWKSFRQRHKK